MVKPFQFSRIPEIIFRSGAIQKLPELASQYGNNVLIVTGKNSFVSSLNGERFFNDLDSSDISHEIFQVTDEPSPGIIDEAVEKYNNIKFDLIIGIGGGSVIDAGKAISAMMHKPGSVAGFLEGVGNKVHPGTKIPYIAVPTTSGTGSEATKNAVISMVGKDGFKRSLRHNNFVPDIALIDPQLTLNCPGNITASGGMDCFTQLTEAYLSEKANPYTDSLAVEGLKAIRYSLIRSFTNGDDIEAREGMSFAALTSGICLANAGLGVIHGFASSVGGMFNIPHGVLCGTLMAISNEINVRELRKSGVNPESLMKYSSLGSLFLDEKGRSDDYYIDGFIEYLHKLTYELQLPSLGTYGINDDDVELLAELTDIKNNPVKLAHEDLNEILRYRLRNNI